MGSKREPRPKGMETYGALAVGYHHNGAREAKPEIKGTHTVETKVQEPMKTCDAENNAWSRKCVETTRRISKLCVGIDKLCWFWQSLLSPSTRRWRRQWPYTHCFIPSHSVESVMSEESWSSFREQSLPSEPHCNILKTHNSQIKAGSGLWGTQWKAHWFCHSKTLTDMLMFLSLSCCWHGCSGVCTEWALHDEQTNAWKINKL